MKGNFVSPLELGMADKPWYVGACQTKTHLLMRSAQLSPPKAPNFTRHTPRVTPVATDVLWTDAPIKPMLKGCATRIISANAAGKMPPRHSGAAYTILRAARVGHSSTAKVGGGSAPVTTVSCAARSYVRYASIFLGVAAIGAGVYTRWLRTISTTTTRQEKTSRCRQPSKTKVLRRLPQKSQNALCSAPTVIG